MYDESYALYKQACIKCKAEPINFLEYIELVKIASLKLRAMKSTIDISPFISYNIEGLIVKFKKISEDNIEINFFTKNDYDDIISKYKEE